MGISPLCFYIGVLACVCVQLVHKSVHTPSTQEVISISHHQTTAGNLVSHQRGDQDTLSTSHILQDGPAP